MPPQGYSPLPDWIESAYLSLERYLCEHVDEDSFTRDQANKHIAEAYPDFSDADIDYALDHLLNRGWLYKVDDCLYITELQCGKFDESTE